MQARLALVILTITLLITGCSNTINRAQYHVIPANQEGVQAVITDADRGAVIAIVTQVAGQLSLRDFTSISRVPNCLAMFQSGQTDNPIKLLAWERDGQIVVDFMHQPTTVGETRPYRAAREDLLIGLQTRFGTRVKLAPIPGVIPARPGGPGAEAGH